MPVIERRSLQNKNGITIRTRKGTPISPEASPQNTTSFGADNIAAGSGTSLLGGAGAGKTWIITSLVVSINPTANNTIRVNFTGGLSAQISMPGSPTAPSPPPVQVITSPTNIGNGGFSVSSVGSGGNYSVSGTAYAAATATVFNSQPGQVTATPIDSDPFADIG